MRMKKIVTPSASKDIRDHLSRRLTPYLLARHSYRVRGVDSVLHNVVLDELACSP